MFQDGRLKELTRVLLPRSHDKQSLPPCSPRGNGSTLEIKNAAVVWDGGKKVCTAVVSGRPQVLVFFMSLESIERMMWGIMKDFVIC